MFLNIGTIVCGFLLGLLLGTRIKNNPKSDVNFTLSSYIVIFIVSVIVAWQMGPFPFYTDMNISSGFIFGAIGLISGRFIAWGLNLK